MNYKILLGFVFLILLVNISYAHNTCTLNPFREITTDDDGNEIELCDTKNPGILGSGIPYCDIDNDASGEEEYTYIQYDVSQCPFDVREDNIIESRLIFGINDKDDAEETDVAFILYDNYCTDWNTYKSELINYGQASYIISDLRDNSCCSLDSSRNHLNCNCDITSTIQTNLYTGAGSIDNPKRISFQWHMDNSCRDDCDNAQVMGWEPDNRNRKAELYIVANEIPVMNCPNLNVNEDAQGPLNLISLNSCTADDDTTFVYNIISQSNVNLINCYLNSDKLTCNTPLLNANGYSDIKIRVTDPHGKYSEKTLRVNVNPVDDLAVWQELEDKTILEDSTETLIYKDLKLKCSDIDSPINTQISSAHSHYSLSFLNNDLVINNLGENYYGVETVNLNCNNIPKSFQFTVNPINDAPTILNLSDITLDEDFLEKTSLDLSTYVNDADNTIQELKFSIEQSNPELINCSLNNTIIECDVPKENAFGESDIIVAVSDLEFNTTGSFKIIVAPVNDAPVFLEIGNKEVYDNETINLDLSEYASDVDNLKEELNFMVESEICSINEHNLICENLAEGLYNVLLRVSDLELNAETNFTINVLKFEIQQDPEPDPPSNSGSSSGGGSGGGRKIEIINEIIEEKVLPAVKEAPKIEQKVKEKVVEEVKEIVEVKENKSISRYIWYIPLFIPILIILIIVGYFFKYSGNI